MSENLGGATEAIFAKLLTHKYFQQDTCACAALNYHSGGRSGAYTMVEGVNSQSYRQRLVRNARQAPSHLI